MLYTIKQLKNINSKRKRARIPVDKTDRNEINLKQETEEALLKIILVNKENSPGTSVTSKKTNKQRGYEANTNRTQKHPAQG